MPKPIKRFERKIFPEPNTGCWLWSGTCNKKGYGVIYVDGKNIAAHRYSYLIHKGPIGNKWVLHACDVRCCANPDHLFLGTHQDNMDDMIKKGRHKALSGINHGNNKLTEDNIRKIRNLEKEGIEQRDIAKMFGVSQHTIWSILRYITWKNIV